MPYGSNTACSPSEYPRRAAGVVNIANLINDWRRETKRISTALGIDLDTGDQEAVEEYLGLGLRHHQNCSPVADLFGTTWISAAYETLSAAARDEPWDESALDRVFDEYRASQHGFGKVFDEFHRFRKLYRLVRYSSSNC